jgi:hypothetical protein
MGHRKSRAVNAGKNRFDSQILGDVRGMVTERFGCIPSIRSAASRGSASRIGIGLTPSAKERLATVMRRRSSKRGGCRD